MRWNMVTASCRRSSWAVVPTAVAGLALALATVLAGCGRSTSSSSTSASPPSAAAVTAVPATAAPNLAPSAPSSALAPVRVHVVSCPVPTADYLGTPYSPQAAPTTLSIPAWLAPPGNAQIFGTEFGPAWYLLGPESATCQGAWGSADDGMIMTATSVSDRSATVTMIIRAGGASAFTDLACPYIPAVRAADEGHVFICTHPRADVIRQISTHTASLYAAAVLVPAQVKDLNIQGSGDGTDPTIALYAAWAGPDAAAGQMIACALAPAQADICAASLKFFLATQAQIRTRMSAANLGRMEADLSSFLAEQGIRLAQRGAREPITHSAPSGPTGRTLLFEDRSSTT
jgi:hypothetical protein